ncbi:MAG TPA: TorF family putative porin [Gammaproteobacteria bacterium]|nr:TorF family putative porin [Gammaproteobacteria bacterium]
MLRPCAPWLCCAVGLAASATAAAQDAAVGVNGYLTLGNGYWSRGLSQNDGLSLQLGVDYQHSSGFFAGGWAANVDYTIEYSAEQPRDVVINAYAGYHAKSEDWSWTVVLGRYLYPGTAITYDYDELGATVGFRDRVFYTASYSPSFYAQSHAALNQELSFALPLRGDLELGATLGRFALAGSSVDYTHWNVGVSKVVRRVVVDLRYYESGYDWISWLGDPNANQYVLSVSYALHGKRTKI